MRLTVCLLGCIVRCFCFLQFLRKFLGLIKWKKNLFLVIILYLCLLIQWVLSVCCANLADYQYVN